MSNVHGSIFQHILPIFKKFLNPSTTFSFIASTLFKNNTEDKYSSIFLFYKVFAGFNHWNAWCIKNISQTFCEKSAFFLVKILGMIAIDK